MHARTGLGLTLPVQLFTMMAGPAAAVTTMVRLCRGRQAPLLLLPARAAGRAASMWACIEGCLVLELELANVIRPCSSAMGAIKPCGVRWVDRLAGEWCFLGEVAAGACCRIFALH